jgi:hypothetical protein
MSFQPYSWVTPRLFRCSQPDTPQEFHQLHRWGITTIIKLSSNNEPFGGLSDSLEKAWFAGRVITREEMGTDYKQTTLAEFVHWMKNCCNLIQSLLGKSPSPQATSPSPVATREIVCVHCTHGKDRTGAMIAAYNVMCRHWHLQEALDDWKNYGGGMVPGEWTDDRPLAAAVTQIAKELNLC